MSAERWPHPRSQCFYTTLVKVLYTNLRQQNVLSMSCVSQRHYSKKRESLVRTYRSKIRITQKMRGQCFRYVVWLSRSQSAMFDVSWIQWNRHQRWQGKLECYIPIGTTGGSDCKSCGDQFHQMNGGTKCAYSQLSPPCWRLRRHQTRLCLYDIRR